VTRRVESVYAFPNHAIRSVGILEPAYEVGGESFDFTLNEHVLHVEVFDAMGHGLEAATMATVIIAAYRHGRLAELALTDLYAAMDQAVATSFPGRFATAQLGRLDTETGVLRWVNAGYPPVLWVRDSRVIGELTGPVSRPVGFGAGPPSCRRSSWSPGTGCCSSPTGSSRSGWPAASSSARSGCAT
jgi:serine phosphatase RsbU (regulator of sigma subunit)